MNIAVDFGNTSIKAGLFEEDQLIERIVFDREKKILDLIKLKKPEHCIFSSVRKGNRKILQEAGKFCNTIGLNSQTPIPLHNLYATPQTLGTDRIAAVVGAQHLYPDRNVLVIDAGTCITYDLLDAEGSYHGGAISPGMDIKFKALHKFTSKLPSIAFRSSYELIGKTSKGSMLSGVINGTIAEMEGMIIRYEQYFEELTILICGGKSKFFESKIKGHIFAIPDLVLIGLNQILRFNV